MGDPANDRLRTQTKSGVVPKTHLIEMLFKYAPLEAVERLSFLADYSDDTARRDYAYGSLATGTARALDITGKLLTDADQHVRAHGSIGVRDAVTG